MRCKIICNIFSIIFTYRVFINIQLFILLQISSALVYFKLFEGKPGDGVAALYDKEEHKLRLYCIRYANTIIILGGGGRKVTDAWQEDPELTDHVELMIRVSKEISERIRNKEIKFINNGHDFEGDLIFTNEKYE